MQLFLALLSCQNWIVGATRWVALKNVFILCTQDDPAGRPYELVIEFGVNFETAQSTSGICSD